MPDHDASVFIRYAASHHGASVVSVGDLADLETLSYAAAVTERVKLAHVRGAAREAGRDPDHP